MLGVVGAVEMVGEDVAASVDEAQLAVVKFEAAIVAHQAHEHGGKVGEGADLLTESLHFGFEPIERALRDGDYFGKLLENAVAIFRSERLGDAAGHDPGRMDAFAGQPFDELLAETS